MRSQKKSEPKNIMKGGTRNNFSDKSLIGNWVENTGGPHGFQRGFTNDEYMTEAQSLQLGNKTIREFGAELPSAQSIIISQRKDREIYHPSNGPQSDSWKTTTQSMLSHGGKPVSEEDSIALPYHLPKKVLDEYTQRWTEETGLGRSQRFSGTDANPSGKLRALPGTPLALERLRQLLVEKYGLLALSSFRSALGKGTISLAVLRDALKTVGIICSNADVNSIFGFSFVTEKPTGDLLVNALKANRASFNTYVAKNIFNSISTSGKVHVSDIQRSLSTDFNEAMVTALSSYLPAYADEEGCLNLDSFYALHEDMFDPNPSAYESIMKLIFATSDFE